MYSFIGAYTTKLLALQYESFAVLKPHTLRNKLKLIGIISYRLENTASPHFGLLWLSI